MIIKQIIFLHISTTNQFTSTLRKSSTKSQAQTANAISNFYGKQLSRFVSSSSPSPRASLFHFRCGVEPSCKNQIWVSVVHEITSFFSENTHKSNVNLVTNRV